MLFVSSLFSVHHSYNMTKNEIVADLNQALAKVINDRGRHIITPDTIKAYKHLRTSAYDGCVLIAVSDDKFCRNLYRKELKSHSFITFDVVDEKYRPFEGDSSIISSDTLIVKDNDMAETLAVRGYARLSSAAILGMSDMSMPSVFVVSALLWAVLLFCYNGKRNESSNRKSVYGGMYYSDTDQLFYGSDNSPIHFTPMQKQLVMMFWNSPCHSVTKEEICAVLWPKKEDANDTLYTLIKRLKPVIENSTDLNIVSDRGKHYSLEIRKLED